VQSVGSPLNFNKLHGVISQKIKLLNIFPRGVTTPGKLFCVTCMGSNLSQLFSPYFLYKKNVGFVTIILADPWHV
jgi:hypothetical protein